MTEQTDVRLSVMEENMGVVDRSNKAGSMVAISWVK